jgi:hypothetical protein
MTKEEKASELAQTIAQGYANICVALHI